MRRGFNSSSQCAAISAPEQKCFQYSRLKTDVQMIDRRTQHCSISATSKVG